MNKTKEYKTFAELCDYKVWKALDFMVKGLLRQDKREDFEINMGTFGCSGTTVCFGCAATCAVQEIHGIEFNAKNIDYRGTRLKALHINGDYSDLHFFEYAIDHARIGLLRNLFVYMKSQFEIVDAALVDECSNMFDLQNDNWREQLPEVRKLIEELKAKDI